MRRQLVTALICLPLLMAGCGALQGPPEFMQDYGVVDAPCAPSATTVAHCTAHVYLMNRGGSGYGHATIYVQMRDADGGTNGPVTATHKCGLSIPEMAGGGHADLTCAFDLPPGRVVAAAPSIWTVDYTAPATSNSATSADLTGIATLALAGAVLVLALVSLLVRREPRREPRRAASSAVDPTARPDAVPSDVTPPGKTGAREPTW